jgi:hypothetical protein
MRKVYLEPKIINNEYGTNPAEFRTGIQPYGSALVKVVDDVNYLIGHGYSLVPAQMYDWANTRTYHFGRIPRTNESTYNIYTNRIHFITVSGLARVTAIAEVGNDMLNSEVGMVFITIPPNGTWTGKIIQELIHNQVDQEFILFIQAYNDALVKLISYSVFEYPRHEINPTSDARGIDRASVAPTEAIYTGTTDQCLNRVLSRDPEYASRRVLFNYAESETDEGGFGD